jgi:Glycosyl hydrolase family 115/Gylcosyl hydrolase family 115 C-terminal domain
VTCRNFRRTGLTATLAALAAAGALMGLPAAAAGKSTGYVGSTPTRGSFPLVAGERAAPIVVSSRDYEGVTRVVGDLRDDVRRVTGIAPAVAVDEVPDGSQPVIVGTIGRSPLIDELVAAGKLEVRGIAGRWETSVEQVVRNPLPGVRKALVIAGSDQRGTIFGAYDLSKQIGVSPWYWWDDVPARQRDELHVLPGRHTQGTPVVKYRGFFINDENPALGRWAPAFFGPGLAPGFPNGFNRHFYARVFEVALRLKANYIWPAVWGRAFAEDDPQNHATAKRYGIVMGTSHEAPMMRGIEEWNRHAKDGTDPYGGNGEWSFRRNADAIKAYWTDGIRRMVEQDFEGVVTLGMRGNGDVGLPDGDGIDLMQSILDAERKIIADVTGGDPRAVPQVWTLYKEVQRYWDKGLRAPDDVTVVFTDDNWGNMRKLPDRDEQRSGGYGLYYHYDYVGGGRNYKWVDTNQLPNVWDQLHQAHRYGVDRLWVVNVGDMKNQELPLQFFLDYAWNPKRWPVRRLRAWERAYAAENFGRRRARPIADLLHDYAALQSRRKPELLNRLISVDPSKDLSSDPSAVVYDDKASPFSLTNYREIERVTDEWRRLGRRSERIGRSIPPAYRDAFYELVSYQIEATANLYELREAEFKNILYARQGRAIANDLADAAEARFAEDQAMSDYYNNELAGGKWKGFQTQPKIGYGDVDRYGPNAPWQQPELDNEALPDAIFPPVQRIEVPRRAEMGVAIDGSDKWWPAESGPAVLPAFSPFQRGPRQYIEVFNRGSIPFRYRVRPARSWVKVTHRSGTVSKQVRLPVHVDWRRAPHGTTRVPIAVRGPGGRRVVIHAVVQNPRVRRSQLAGFVEAGGYVSMEAGHFTRAVRGGGARWKRIPGIGRTGDGMEPFPVTAPSRAPGSSSPRLEYETTLFTKGPVKLWAYLSPRNPTLSPDGLRYAVSIDGEPPQVVNITKATGADDTAMNRQWERNTSDNVNRTATTHMIRKPGRHVIKIWMVDPTVVVQKLVLDTGGLRTSYLGPPESRRYP